MLYGKIHETETERLGWGLALNIFNFDLLGFCIGYLGNIPLLPPLQEEVPLQVCTELPAPTGATHL